MVSADGDTSYEAGQAVTRGKLQATEESHTDDNQTKLNREAYSQKYKTCSTTDYRKVDIYDANNGFRSASDESLDNTFRRAGISPSAVDADLDTKTQITPILVTKESAELSKRFPMENSNKNSHRIPTGVLPSASSKTLK